MEDFEWQDPLLITDASSLQQKIHTQTHRESEIPCSLEISSMEEDPDDSSPSKIDGRSELGFSLTSPDLVLCIDSPDIPNQRYIESPEFLKGAIIDVSLENGIEGSEIKNSFKTPTALSQDLCTESSFELVTSQLIDENSKNCTEMSINVGSTCGVVCQNGMNFSEDISFIGGDTVRTEDSIIGEDGEGSLYQTARSGNFSYHFKNLECGAYLVDLHFAEIVFTNGPPGKRIFDVFLQDQKAVSSLDIYARVGANVPLVISDLRTYIKGDEGISIRLEGVNGNPIVCGMSVRKDYSKISGEIELEGTKLTYMQQCESLNDIESCSNDGDLHRLQVEHAFQKKELSETKRVLEELKKENDLKSRECQEAWKSLIDLQNELMRKSMHVGSLAFAIEGQVKEKSRWFSSLRNLTRKLKILKMDHLKLSEEASVLKQYLVDAEGVNSTITDTLNQHVQLHEHIKTKFLQEVKEKKELYNKVLELTGNIRVFCRCRPMNNEEITGGASKAVEFEAAKEGELIVKSNGISRKIFKFDTVFSPEADQVEVFEETAPLASSVLDGYNVCIFAYGQTGTGKTFTMEGTNEARGVNYRTLEKLFQIIDERKNMFRYEVSVSVLEVYNEQIRDLLVSGSQLTTNAKRLEIKQVGEGEHHVPGLIEANVNNVCEVWDVLRTGSNGRAVGSTNANEHSSRSHCMHCVMVKGENLLNGECTKSKLWLVDLAGSERIAKSEVQGERLKETQNINRSLSALGDVISALATKSSHVPFRNSKLTHLLQDSLGGDSKTLMFVQISPNENDITETLCSLNFASRVRGIELGPAKKQTDNTELLKYKQMVEKLKQDMKSKDFQVRKMEDTNYDLELKMKERDVKNRNLQDKIKELESQLLVERKLGRQHVDSKIAEQHQKQEEQHHSEPMRASLSTKTLASISKSHFANKVDQDNNNNNNITRSSSENNKHSFWPPPTIGSTKNSIEKENNPKISDQFLLPNRIIGRASLCPTFQRIPSAATAPRRNSLIPFPTGTAKVPPSLLPLAPIQDDSNNDENEAKVACLPCDNSPNEQRNRSKKLGSVLRRSVQKKSHMMRSPMQPHLRRVGVNVGLEKLRVSIGGRGKNGQRLFLGNARRVVTRDTTTQTKQNHREKERGWNLGTRSRNVL